MSSLNTKHLKQYRDILTICDSSAIQQWKSETFDNALSWAKYFDSQKLGPKELKYLLGTESTQLSMKQVLFSKLLRNPNLNEVLLEKIVNAESQNFIIEQLSTSVIMKNMIKLLPEEGVKIGLTKLMKKTIDKKSKTEMERLIESLERFAINSVECMVVV